MKIELTALILPIVFFLVSRFFHIKMIQRRKHWDWRDSMLLGYVAIALLFTITTEGLSIFGALNRSMVILCWGVFLLTSMFALTRMGSSGSRTDPSLENKVINFKLFDWLMLVSLIIICAAVGVTAFQAPPDGKDVIAYHMTRIMHWIQNQSTAHYAVPDARQLWMPPWPAYAQTHLYLLAGGDRLSNMIQWSGMVVALIAVSKMAALLGARLRGQLAATLFAATVPVGIFQASSSFTDYSAGAWVVVTAWLVLRSLSSEFGWIEWLALGLSTASGYLTKGTYVLFALPFMVWFIVQQLSHISWRVWLMRGAVVLLLILVLVAPYWIRNWRYFDSIMGPEAHVDMLSNETYDLKSLFSNILRHTAIKFASPSRRLNSFLNDTVVDVLVSAGLDPYDPDLSYRGTRFNVDWLFPGSDSAPLHGAVVVLLLPIITLFKTYRKKQLLWFYFAVALGYMLFCGYIRWQAATRFSFSVFLLLAPVVGWVYERGVFRWLAPPMLFLLVIYAAPSVFFNRWRPLIGWRPRTATESIFCITRNEMLFRDWDPLASQYQETAAMVLETNCKSVALRANSNDLEYYWWILLDPFGNNIELKHTLVYPGLEDLVDTDYEPCALICTVCSDSPNDRNGLWPVNLEDDINLYLPADQLDSIPWPN